jgi:hypothetical protein
MMQRQEPHGYGMEGTVFLDMISADRTLHKEM